MTPRAVQHGPAPLAGVSKESPKETASSRWLFQSTSHPLRTPENRTRRSRAPAPQCLGTQRQPPGQRALGPQKPTRIQIPCTWRSLDRWFGGVSGVVLVPKSSCRVFGGQRPSLEGTIDMTGCMLRVTAITLMGFAVLTWGPLKWQVSSFSSHTNKGVAPEDHTPTSSFPKPC